MRRAHRRTGSVATAIATAAGLVLIPGAAQAGDRSLPSSMAAIGDSISQAFNTHSVASPVPFPPDQNACPDGLGGITGFPFDCPRNSWSTGSNPAVNSLATRLTAVNPALAGHTSNEAVSGQTVSDLPRQAAAAVATGSELVTVDIGINDACTPTVAAETPLATFAAEFRQAMQTLAASPARPTIEVISIPDVYREWQLFHADPNAQFRWQLASVCQAMFANPTSFLPADNARRLTVAVRIVEYNLIEAIVCAQTSGCRTDGGAVHRWRFTPADIATVADTGSITNIPALATFPVFGPGVPNSTGDYFHPSAQGQAAIAALAWQYSGFADR